MTPAMTILGSSSRGNGYILSAGNDKLIIECGAQVKKALHALDYDVSAVAGCVTTHKHNDHSKYINQYQEYFRKVYSTQECCETYKGAIAFEPKTRYMIGGFSVIPLSVPHGDCQCFAYIIEHERVGRLCFCTDAQDFPYDIKGINHLFIEANYTNEAVINNAVNGRGVRSRYDTHMSLETAMEICRRLYNPELRTVCAIHLSDSNADEGEIRDRFKNELGINIVIAENNLVIPLMNNEF